MNNLHTVTAFRPSGGVALRGTVCDKISTRAGETSAQPENNHPSWLGSFSNVDAVSSPRLLFATLLRQRGHLFITIISRRKEV